MLERSEVNRCDVTLLAGNAVFALLVAAVAGLVVGAILAIVRAHPRLPIAPTTVALLALMLGLITGCVFVATKPGPAGWVGVGTSFWMFGAGAVLGIAAAQRFHGFGPRRSKLKIGLAVSNTHFSPGHFSSNSNACSELIPP